MGMIVFDIYKPQQTRYLLFPSHYSPRFAALEFSTPRLRNSCLKRAEQSLSLKWLVQECHCAGFHRPGASRFIDMCSDKDCPNWPQARLDSRIKLQARYSR